MTSFLPQTKKTSEQSELCSDVVPLSTLNLKKVNAALACCRSISRQIEQGEVPEKAVKPDLYGKDVKMVDNLTLRPKMLTQEERAGVIAKYQSGITMSSIADIYGCHYTTVGRILRKAGVEIRQP